MDARSYRVTVTPLTLRQGGTISSPFTVPGQGQGQGAGGTYVLHRGARVHAGASVVAADQLAGADAALAHAAPEGGPPRALELPVPLGAELHIKYASFGRKEEGEDKTGRLFECVLRIRSIRHDHIRANMGRRFLRGGSLQRSGI